MLNCSEVIRPAPASTVELSRAIMCLVDELRLAQSACLDGPQILLLVNELAVACEDLFETREAEIGSDGSDRLDPVRLMHSRFLDAFAEYAEQIRARNGMLDKRFFDFLDDGPLPALRFAA